jgi:DNA invertase Pin-like site-specific DNA recombinase
MARSQSNRGEVIDDELKEAVKDLTPAGTQEIADRVGLTRQAVDYRLRKIEDRYENPWVWSKKIGPTKIWMHADHIFPR